MYTTRTYTMSLAAAVAALVAPALLFLGAGTAQAVDPLPEPPSIGDHGLNPPPGLRVGTAAPHLNPPPGLRIALGGPDTKVGLGGPDTGPAH